MKQLILPLVDWSNGIIMIGIFALVVVVLVAVMLSLINSGNKNKS